MLHNIHSNNIYYAAGPVLRDSQVFTLETAGLMRVSPHRSWLIDGTQTYVVWPSGLGTHAFRFKSVCKSSGVLYVDPIFFKKNYPVLKKKEQKLVYIKLLLWNAWYEKPQEVFLPSTVLFWLQKSLAPMGAICGVLIKNAVAWAPLSELLTQPERCVAQASDFYKRPSFNAILWHVTREAIFAIILLTTRWRMVHTTKIQQPGFCKNLCRWTRRHPGSLERLKGLDPGPGTRPEF